MKTSDKKLKREPMVRKTPTDLKDYIKYPNHYTSWGIECWDYIESNNFNYFEWCIIKYVHRYKFKNWLEDLKKAKQYLDKLIENKEKEDLKKWEKNNITKWAVKFWKILSKI